MELLRVVAELLEMGFLQVAVELLLLDVELQVVVELLLLVAVL